MSNKIRPLVPSPESPTPEDRQRQQAEEVLENHYNKVMPKLYGKAGPHSRLLQVRLHLSLDSTGHRQDRQPQA